MSFHLPRWLRLAAAATGTATAVAAAGCGTSPVPSSAAAGAGPEKTHLTVAVVGATDEVPFEIALKRGFFTRQGLTITTVPIKTSTSAIAPLVRGSIDVIASANYVSFFEGEVSGALHIKVIAPAGSCTADDFAVMTRKGSSIQKPSDLAGATIGVPQLDSVVTLTIDAQLSAHGVNPGSVHFIAIPFQDALAALDSREVDAVSLIEPFLTNAEVTAGAQAIMPLCTGPTANLPLTGDVTTAAWAARYPRTAAAYATAIAEGAQVAQTDRAAEEHALASLVTLSPASMYALVNYNAYPLTLNPVAIQQNASLMYQAGMLKKPLSVRALLFLPQAGGGQ